MSFNELLERNYENMVVRECRAERTIQSLKLALCSLEAERNLEKGSQKSDLSSRMGEEATNQLKKLSWRSEKGSMQKTEQEARKENWEKAGGWGEQLVIFLHPITPKSDQIQISPAASPEI